MIRCNNCYKIFNNDEDLEMLCDFKDTERPEFYKGCPDCKTDGYLMDIKE